MELLDSKNRKELLQSIIAEVAKTANEVNCAAKDVAKARNRLTFLIAVANELLNREEI